MGWLDGKRALVVGAGSGIGRAVAVAFRGEGARVAVLERDAGKAGRLADELPGCPPERQARLLTYAARRAGTTAP